MARTTLKDIAVAANISVTTVSHALNGTRYVSARTRARIQELAQLMEYRPDPIARMLQGQGSLLIGHVLSILHSNPFFERVARGADLRAQEEGYATLLAYTHRHADAEKRAVAFLLEQRVAGIIFTHPHAPANVEMVVAAGVAAVMVERPLAVRGAHAVLVDHRAGLRELTQVLIAQGHLRLAYIGGDYSLDGSDFVERQRLRGFRDAAAAAGLAVPRSHIVLVPYHNAPARAACQAVLGLRPRPTALVIGSDLLAAGVLQVLYEHGVRVPDDLSLVSADDTLGPYMAPPLSESDPQTEELGRQAVDLIVEHAQGSAPRSRGRRVLLQPRLHLRASTRSLAGSDDSDDLPAAAPVRAAASEDNP